MADFKNILSDIIKEFPKKSIKKFPAILISRKTHKIKNIENGQNFQKLANKKIIDENKCEIEKLSIEELPPFSTTVMVNYSALNFKDALALTGAKGICRTFPMVPGIDFVGRIVNFSNEKKFGDLVICTGKGHGEKHWGGLSAFVKTRPEWLVKVPPNLTARQAATYGTAGFTAMICVESLLSHFKNDLTKKNILVTGASGGVGMFSVAFLSKMGASVTALSGNKSKFDQILKFGAKKIIFFSKNDGKNENFEVKNDQKIEKIEKIEKIPPLSHQKWDGAIDTVGGKILQRAISECKYAGKIICCGNAAESNFESSIFPFILRGVTLQGVDSVEFEMAARQKIWAKMAELWDESFEAENFRKIVGLNGVIEVAKEMVGKRGKSFSRAIVEIVPEEIFK